MAVYLLNIQLNSLHIIPAFECVAEIGCFLVCIHSDNDYVRVFHSTDLRLFGLSKYYGSGIHADPRSGSARFWGILNVYGHEVSCL